jgi:hypothetical protein
MLIDFEILPIEKLRNAVREQIIEHRLVAQPCLGFGMAIKPPIV